MGEQEQFVADAVRGVFDVALEELKQAAERVASEAERAGQIVQTAVGQANAVRDELHLYGPFTAAAMPTVVFTGFMELGRVQAPERHVHGWIDFPELHAQSCLRQVTDPREIPPGPYAVVVCLRRLG